MVMLAFISVGLVGYFWIANEYERFTRERIALTEKYFANQKALINDVGAWMSDSIFAGIEPETAA